MILFKTYEIALTLFEQQFHFYILRFRLRARTKMGSRVYFISSFFVKLFHWLRKRLTDTYSKILKVFSKCVLGGNIISKKFQDLERFTFISN